MSDNMKPTAERFEQLLVFVDACVPEMQLKAELSRLRRIEAAARVWKDAFTESEIESSIRGLYDALGVTDCDSPYAIDK